MQKRQSVITAMSYSLGDQEYSVEESSERGLLISTVEVLREAGFAKHRMAAPGQSAYDLAKRAVSGLGGTEKLKDVDAIVYATCIPHNANLGDADRFRETRDVKFLMDYAVSHLQADFGMHNAIAFGLTQQACTGLLGGLRLAKMLIDTEPSFKKVLCLTSDRFPEGALYEQAFNLICDGAAATLVEADGEGFVIESGHQLTNGAMAQANDDETVGHFFNYTSRLFKESLARIGLGVADLRWIVPQNTNSKAWLILSRLLGFPFESVALHTLGTVGHMISGDNVVNLLSLARSGQIREGERLMLMMAGYGLNWQSIILRKQGDFRE